MFIDIESIEGSLATGISERLGRAGRVTTGHYARRIAEALSRGEAAPLDAATSGDPDLVVVLDVEPWVWRLRQTLGEWTGSPRSSAARQLGEGFAAAMRLSLLEQARRSPERFVVVAGVVGGLERWASAVGRALRLRDGGGGVYREGRRGPPSPPLSDSKDAFFAMVDALEDGHGELALAMLEGVGGPAAHQRRLAWLEARPELAARSLLGVDDDESWTLRELLAPAAPQAVLQSLGTSASARALRLRARMVDKHPAEVVRTLGGQDSPQAWWLRQQALRLRLMEPVLESLAGLDTERAWRLRNEHTFDADVFELARSVRGLSSPRADALRSTIVDEAPLTVLESTAGVDSPFCQMLRMKLLDTAPAAVMRSTQGLDDETSWILREAVAERCPEAIRASRGLGSARAWALRERLVGRWPAATIDSLEGLEPSARSRGLLEAVADRAADPLVVRAVYFASRGWAVEPSGRTAPQPARAEQQL